MGIERVVLEDHCDITLLRGQVGDIAIADADDAVGDALEAGHQSENGRLAATRRADEDEELAIRYVEAEIPGGDIAVRVDLVDVLQGNSGHGFR